MNNSQQKYTLRQTFSHTMLQFELEGTFAGNVSDIYAAWHEPKRLINWFSLNDLVVGQIMSDFRVGGKFRFQLYDINGMAHVLMGEYTDIQKDNRLCFSWQWVGEPHLSEVEVLFDDVNDETTSLQIIHSGFDDEEDMALHHQAWVGCLDRLTLAAMQVR